MTDICTSIFTSDRTESQVVDRSYGVSQLCKRELHNYYEVVIKEVIKSQVEYEHTLKCQDMSKHTMHMCKG